MIEVSDLTVSYPGRRGPVTAIAGLDLSLAGGETCAVIGPSGCGKTTLLYVLAGLLAPSAGTVLVGGEAVRPQRRATALILQDYGLLPWKTVQANAALGLEIRGLGRRQAAEGSERALRRLGLWGVRHHFPSQISGGQRQRVAIARALVLEPDLLLMDEPFSSLDALTREELQETVLAIWRERRMTIVLVTHSIEEAVFLGQRIYVLSPGPARLSAVIANPGAGSSGYRRAAAYHERCVQVRAALEDACREVAR